MFQTSHLRSTLVTGASVIALGAIAAPALAQPAAQPADQGANANVVVIAQHTATKLQKIPVAVSVFTGASRDRLGISTVQEVTNFAPGFVYDPTTVHAYIRGIGRQSINVTDDQRVATYEDEFYVYSPYGLDKSSLFLSQEQIERGPQNVGGRQAAAGSIDMISVRPTNHPYAEVRATIGNYNHYEVEGAASDEIAPGLDGRIAGYWNDQEQGYLKNVAGGPSEFYHIKEWYVEGQLDWKVDDHSDLWARSFFSGWNNLGDAGARQRLFQRPLGRGQPDGQQRVRRLRPLREPELRLLRDRPRGRGRAQSRRPTGDRRGAQGARHLRQPLDHQLSALCRRWAEDVDAQGLQRLQLHLHLPLPEHGL